MVGINRIIGAYFESVALNYFINRNYTLVTRNYYTKHSEIDLVISKDKRLYFIEVKYRDSPVYGQAFEAINSTKLRRLKQAVSVYLTNKVHFKEYQLDVLAINGVRGEIIFEHIEDVFSL